LSRINNLSCTKFELNQLVADLDGVVTQACEFLETLILLALNGAPERIRTSDLCLRRKLLFGEYQLFQCVQPLNIAMCISCNHDWRWALPELCWNLNIVTVSPAYTFSSVSTESAS